MSTLAVGRSHAVGIQKSNQRAWDQQTYVTGSTEVQEVSTCNNVTWCAELELCLLPYGEDVEQASQPSHPAVAQRFLPLPADTVLVHRS